MIAQLLAVATGLWLMAAPAVIGYGAPAATIDRLLGPLAATIGAVAVCQSMRIVRLWNLPLGVALLAAPLLLVYPAPAALNDFFCGCMLIVCSRIQGRLTHRFGGGWASLLHASRERRS